MHKLEIEYSPEDDSYIFIQYGQGSVIVPANELTELINKLQKLVIKQS